MNQLTSIYRGIIQYLLVFPLNFHRILPPKPTKHNLHLFKDFICAKSISVIWKTKAALCLLSVSLHTHTHTHARARASHLPSAHSPVLCCYLGDVMCNFSLKALSQNGLFHQSSRRGALCLWQGFSIQDKEQSCPSFAAWPTGCLIRNKTTEARQNGDVCSTVKSGRMVEIELKSSLLFLYHNESFSYSPKSFHFKKT